MSDFSEFVVYADESGDHGLVAIDPQYPVFALVFCALRKADYITGVVPAVQRFKFGIWGHDAVVLHEHDIRKSKATEVNPGFPFSHWGLAMCARKGRRRGMAKIRRTGGGNPRAHNSDPQGHGHGRRGLARSGAACRVGGLKSWCCGAGVKQDIRTFEWHAAAGRRSRGAVAMAWGRRRTREAGGSNRSGDYSITELRAPESRLYRYGSKALF